VGGPNTRSTNPRWRTAAILKKNVKSTYLSKRLIDFDEIWHGDAHWPPVEERPLKFRIFQNQDGGSRHLEIPQKSRYHNKGSTDLRAIWHDYAKCVS